MTTTPKSESASPARTDLPLWEGQLHHNDKLAAEHIRVQLSRILKSPIFSLSTRLSRFLRFVVETALADQGHTLKEYVIGTDVYDRRSPYHPSQDSIVRTEARRLRTKLKEYYDSEGKADPIFIYFRSGSYVPVFFSRDSQLPEDTLSEKSETSGPTDYLQIFVTIIPFEDVSGDSLAKDCARAIVEELGHQLMMIEGCQVTDAGAASHFPSNLQASPPAVRKREEVAHLVFQGTVARNDRFLRITSRLTDREGIQFWSQHFDLETERKHLFELNRQVASALISRTRIQELRAAATGGEKTPAHGRIGSLARSSETLMDQDLQADWSKIRLRLEAIQRAGPLEAHLQTGIAHCLIEQTLSGASGSSTHLACAKRAVFLALESTPRLSEAQACLGFVLALEGDLAAAESCFNSSWSSGSNATGHRQYALLLTALGRFNDSWHHLQKAHMIDPFSSRQKVARSKVLYCNRKFKQLASEHDGPLLYGPRPLESQILAALSYLEVDRADQARELAHHIRREAIVRPHLMASAAEIFARCGDMALPKQIAEQYGLFTEGSPVSKLRQASLAIAWGERKLALDALFAASKQKEPERLWLSVDPRFDGLRSAPLAVGMEHSTLSAGPVVAII